MKESAHSIPMKQNHFFESRQSYYSLNTEEQFSALMQLAECKNNDSVRELIHIYEECEWRETKFFVVKGLSRYLNERAIIFLMKECLSQKDIPLVEAILEALSDSKNAFLKLFFDVYIKNCDLVFQPAATIAIGKTQSVEITETLILLFETSLRDENYNLLKSVLLSFGEVKDNDSIKLIESILNKKQLPRDLLLTAIVSLGRISRDPKQFEKYESTFKNDSFEYQIFQNSRNQCVFRSQWSIEDYLSKILKQDLVHSGIWVEFNSFTEKEVSDALELIYEEGHTKIVYTIVLNLSEKFIEIQKKYFEKLNLNSQNEELLIDLLEKNSSKSFNKFGIQTIDSYFFHKIDVSSKLIIKIIKHILCTTDFDNIQLFNYIKNFLLRKEIDFEDKIELINYLELYLIAQSSNKNYFLQIIKSIEIIAEELFDVKFETHVDYTEDIKYFLRFLRVFSIAQLNSKKINELIFEFYVSLRQILNLQAKLQLLVEVEVTVLNCYSLQDKIFFVNKLDERKIDILEENYGIYLRLLSQNQKSKKSNLSHEFVLDKILLLKNDEKKHLLALKYLTQFYDKKYKSFIIEKFNSQNIIIKINSIFAMKMNEDEDFVDCLSIGLKHEALSISGRSLDAILNFKSIKAKRVAFDYFIYNIEKRDVVIKFLKEFDIHLVESDYFYKKLDELISQKKLNDYLEEDIIERITDLRQSLFQKAQKQKYSQFLPTEAEIKNIDIELSQIIKCYAQFDESAKQAIRSSELVIKHPELFVKFVDKSSVVLGYAKAIDIILEHQFARRYLSSSFETKLHEFQNVIHRLGLNSDYPQSDRILGLLNLEKDFSTHSLPVHKMSLIAKAILNGKILNDSHKVLDGLRAWSIIFLLFCRKHKALDKKILNSKDSESDYVELAKKLIWLQDVRNPMAHRQTISEWGDLLRIRNEVLSILNIIMKLFF